MSDAARASLWVSGTSVATALVAWLFSFAGGTALWFVFDRPPPWLGIERGRLLSWQALGMTVVFLLALLAVRLWSAPPWLWLGALALSTLLAGRYLVWYAELEAGALHGPYADLDHLLYSRPFNDPYVTVAALVGYPVAIGLGCLLGSRLLIRQAAARRRQSVSHAEHARRAVRPEG